MRTIFILFITITSLLAHNVDAKTPPSRQEKATQTYLFVLHAKKGMIEKSDSEYSLKLVGVSDHLTFFTDRPNRLAGKVPITEFIQEWDEGKDNFAQNPPNAGLAILESKGNNLADIIIVLKQPWYTKKNNSLSFSIELVDKSQSIDEMEFDDVTLFIDEGFGRCACERL